MIQQLPGDLLDSLAAAWTALTTVQDVEGRPVCEMDHERSMGDRLAGRAGRATSLTLNGTTLTLQLTRGRRQLEGLAAHEVRGVVISRRPVTVEEWRLLAADELRGLGGAGIVPAWALPAAMAALGVDAPDDIAVPADDIAAGLSRLPGLLRGRAPDDVRAVVDRLCATLGDLLPRLAGADPQDRFSVERTATDYLPQTLRHYLDLPRDWAESRVDAHGRTALDDLRGQLAVLDDAITRMRDAVLDSDADALRAHGLFLADRFRTSALDTRDPGGS